jgi:hypothetical protein
MATYVITRRRTSNPDNESERIGKRQGYQYRRYSREGYETVEEAFARLTDHLDRSMWRYDHNAPAVFVKSAAD